MLLISHDKNLISLLACFGLPGCFYQIASIAKLFFSHCHLLIPVAGAVAKMVAIFMKIEICFYTFYFLFFYYKWCFRFHKIYSFHCFFVEGAYLLQSVSTPYLNNDVKWTFSPKADRPCLLWFAFKKKLVLMSSKYIDVI